MKKSYLSFAIPIIISVFLICFAIGRANAIKDIKNEKLKEENAQQVEETVIPTTSDSEKVEKTTKEEPNKKNRVVKKVTEKNNTPPEKMLFPCGNNILTDYTQDAIYSKTMDDWRAHTGIDYAAEIGENVLSIWDGEVENVYKDMLWGYTVEILHDGNLKSIYKNLDKQIKVKKGDSVNRGQVIGSVGNSAVVEQREAPHLHFELWTGGAPINPNSYIY